MKTELNWTEHVNFREGTQEFTSNGKFGITWLERGYLIGWLPWNWMISARSGLAHRDTGKFPGAPFASSLFSKGLVIQNGKKLSNWTKYDYSHRLTYGKELHILLVFQNIPFQRSQMILMIFRPWKVFWKKLTKRECATLSLKQTKWRRVSLKIELPAREPAKSAWACC